MKVAVALSGGIDSAGTALQFKREGHDVFGITMHLFEHQTTELEAAKSVAKQLGIPHHIVDFRQIFETDVIEPFIASYESGQTPNPCLFCNHHLKYGKLLDEALNLGADKFATGHYAKLTLTTNGIYQIERAINQRKDQSYNLFQLNQSQLKHILLPLGEVLSKETLRDEYAKLDVKQSEKKDSQGICFIKRGAQMHFLKSRKSTASQPGYFVDITGKRLGKHLGISGYTIGQKKGIVLKDNPSYVVIGINGANQTVVLGDESHLYTDSVLLPHFNYLNPEIQTKATEKPIEVTVKTSQWSPFYDGTLTHTSAGTHIIFNTPVRGLTHGQAIVCYQGNTLVGGGKY